MNTAVMFTTWILAAVLTVLLPSHGLLAESRDPAASPLHGQALRVDAIDMVLAYIPPGTFEMGSPPDEPGRYSDETRHRVTISRGYYIGVTEVTQAEYQKVMGHNPSDIKADGLPVTHVSWKQALAFCARLSRMDGRTCRLPTEAEWEYACRAGDAGPFAGIGNVNELAWHLDNSDEKSHPIARKASNAWGLYDMHGNVMEWCADWYGDPYPSGTATDPTGPTEGKRRVVRGGSWRHRPRACRPAARACYAPSYQLPHLGFRVVMEDTQPANETK